MMITSLLTCGRLLRLGAACVLVVLSACGGSGSGPADTSGQSNPPGGGGQAALRITGSIYAFPAGSSTPFISGGGNTIARIQVREEPGDVIVPTATVSINGTALNYVATDFEYAGALNVAKGSQISLSVQSSGISYSGSVSAQGATPNITAPTTGTVWNGMSSGTVGWAATSSATPYAVGVFNLGGVQVWPTNGSLMSVSAVQGQVAVDTSVLGEGTVWVAVGQTQTMSVTGADTASGIVVGTFGYDPVTVDSKVGSLVSLSVTPTLRSVYLGRALQLTATARYADGSLNDVTRYAIWNSADTGKFTVAANGMATAIAPGSTAISAQYAGLSGSDIVTAFQPNPSPTAPLSQSVGFQIDAAHSGRVTFGSTGPTFPPSARWSTTLNGEISYPIIADGRVFVTTGTSLSGVYGTSLYALDLSTGDVLWGPIAIAGTYFVSNLAYDHGTLFVLNFDGVLQSFDAATGTPGWTRQMPDQTSSFAAPTAVNGVIYASGSAVGANVYAVDELNGNLLWDVGASGGDGSSPTVSADGVFVSYICHVYKFDLVTGAVDWHYNLGCDGGGGITSVYWNGLLFDRDVSPMNPPSLILDAQSGQAVRPFSAYTMPAFSDTTGFFVVGEVLNAVDPSSENIRWTFPGDGRLSSSPIVIDNVVVVGSASGTVYAVDATSGQMLWSDVAGPTIGYQEGGNATSPWTGLGAGEGYLVVPAANVLTGYRLLQ